MSAQGQLRASGRQPGVRPSSVVYAVSQLMLAQIGLFYDEDGAAIPEVRDDFVIGYAMQLTELVLARRRAFGVDARQHDAQVVLKLVLEDLFDLRCRDEVLQRWRDLAEQPTQQSVAGGRCAERDMGRLALEEVPMGLRAHIHNRLIIGSPE